MPTPRPPEIPRPAPMDAAPLLCALLQTLGADPKAVALNPAGLAAASARLRDLAESRSGRPREAA